MKWIVALAALLTAAPATPEVATGPNTPIFDGMPPARLQHDNAQIVVFTSDIAAFCGPSVDGFVIIACARTIKGAPVLILPNPCPLGDAEFYARVACHELGHRNSWSANHEDK